jgi:hypothetical protein
VSPPPTAATTHNRLARVADDMGDPACYREFCPDCDTPVSIVDEECPDCGRALKLRGR